MVKFILPINSGRLIGIIIGKNDRYCIFNCLKRSIGEANQPSDGQKAKLSHFYRWGVSPVVKAKLLGIGLLTQQVAAPSTATFSSKRHSTFFILKIIDINRIQ